MGFIFVRLSPVTRSAQTLQVGLEVIARVLVIGITPALLCLHNRYIGGDNVVHDLRPGNITAFAEWVSLDNDVPHSLPTCAFALFVQLLRVSRSMRAHIVS